MDAKETKIELTPEELEQASGGAADFSENQFKSLTTAEGEQLQANAARVGGKRENNSVSMQTDDEMLRKAEDIISCIAQYQKSARVI